MNDDQLASAKQMITQAIGHHNEADSVLQSLYLLLNPSGDNRSVVPLGQRNQPWAGDTLGFSTHRQTISDWGCTLTTIAMFLNFITSQAGYTPRTVNESLKAHGGFTWDAQHTDQNLVLWTALPSIFPQLKFNGKIDCPDSPAPLDVVDSILVSGLPVIVYVDASPLSGLQQHFVLITFKRTTTYDIANPWTGTMQTLTPQYGPNPSQAICGIVKLGVAV